MVQYFLQYRLEMVQYFADPTSRARLEHGDHGRVGAGWVAVGRGASALLAVSRASRASSVSRRGAASAVSTHHFPGEFEVI